MWEMNILSCSASNKIPASPNNIVSGIRCTTTPAQCSWTDAINACPNGYHLPSKIDIDLLSQNLYKSPYLPGWKISNYWLSDEFNAYDAYYSSIRDNNPNTGFMANYNNYGNKTDINFVKCVAD